MKSVPFASLLLAAPEPPLEGLNDAGGILDQPAFLPLEDNESLSGYAPGILRILPLNGRARFFSYSEHKRRERYGLAGGLFLACIAFGLLGMGVIYFLTDAGCADALGLGECNESIIEDFSFRLETGIFVGGVLLYSVYLMVVWLDPRVGSSACVELPEDLRLELYSDRIRATKAAAATMEKPKKSLGEKAVLFGVKKAVGWAAKLLLGHVGGIVGEATVATALEGDAEEQHRQKSEITDKVKKDSAARIVEVHRRLTGREPVAVPAAEFMTMEAFDLGSTGGSKPAARKRRRRKRGDPAPAPPG